MPDCVDTDINQTFFSEINFKKKRIPRVPRVPQIAQKFKKESRWDEQLRVCLAV